VAAAAAVMPFPLAVAAIAAILVSGPPLFADVASLLCLTESVLPLFGNTVS